MARLINTVCIKYGSFRPESNYQIYFPPKICGQFSIELLCQMILIPLSYRTYSDNCNQIIQCPILNVNRHGFLENHNSRALKAAFAAM